VVNDGICKRISEIREKQAVKCEMTKDQFRQFLVSVYSGEAGRLALWPLFPSIHLSNLVKSCPASSQPILSKARSTPSFYASRLWSSSHAPARGRTQPDCLRQRRQVRPGTEDPPSPDCG
jgi:hypothetical protein